MDKTDEIKVFITTRDSSRCGECGEELSRGDWITLEEKKGALCLSCADSITWSFFLRGMPHSLVARASIHYFQPSF